MNANLLPIDREINPVDYLNAAKAAAAYIEDFQTVTDHGIYWMATPDGEAVLDLYNGSSGIILFFIQLAELSEDFSYLDKACQAGDYIIWELQHNEYSYMSTIRPHKFTSDNNLCSLYVGGLSGVAYALIQLSLHSHNKRYEECAFQIMEKIVSSAVKTREGIVWNGYSGVFQDSGVILSLLYAASYFQTSSFVNLAAEAGKTIALSGKKISETETLYLCVKDRFHYFDQQTLAAMPGFSHGTAGITYTLAFLYKVIGDDIFLSTAEKGAKYLIRKSRKIRRGKLTPYIVPDNSDQVYYLGYCNGAVGTSRLFLLLDQLTRKKEYHQQYLDLIQGVIDTGAPEYHSAGYWNTQTICCGTAGFIDMFLKAYRLNRDPQYLELAGRSARILLGNSSYDGKKAYWPSAFMRLIPTETAAEIGYMSGAAGIGESFLQLYAQLTGNNNSLIYLPDDPDIRC